LIEDHMQAIIKLATATGALALIALGSTGCYVEAYADPGGS
jgi:hypothetical protein